MGVDDSSVLLGYVHAGTVRAEFMRSVLGITTGPGADRRIGGTDDATAGSLIGKARNMLVRKLLASPYDWLFMVDTDVVFSPVALARLADYADPARHPVVSGVVPIVRPDGSTPASVFSIFTEPAGLRAEPVPMAAWPAGSVFEADACGAALMLAHRSVFEKIAADAGPVWFHPMTVGETIVSEDIAFCLRMRAVGVRPAIAAAVRAGHVKPLVFGSIT